MSTILEALRRLESDKANETRNERIRGDVLAPSPHGGRTLRRRRFVWLAAALLAAGALGGLAGSLVGGAGQSEMDPSSGSGSGSGSAAVEAGSAVSGVEMGLPPRRGGAPAVGESTAELPRGAERPPAVAAPPSDLPERVSTARAASSGSPPSAMMPVVPPSPARVSAAPDAAAVAPPATRSRVESALGAVPAEPSKRVELPDITVASTVWHPQPERRLARIAVSGAPRPIELHEGDAYGGWIVRQISPSGVTFDHGSVTVLRRVGESER